MTSGPDKLNNIIKYLSKDTYMLAQCDYKKKGSLLAEIQQGTMPFCVYLNCNMSQHCVSVRTKIKQLHGRIKAVNI